MTTITVPTLPIELLGQPVTWRDWDIAPVMSHVPFDCAICAHDDPPAVALGRGAATFFAVRCRHCQTTRVSYREPGFPGRRRLAWQYDGTEVTASVRDLPDGPRPSPTRPEESL